MMLLAIMTFYLGAGFTAAVLDYFDYEEMMEAYDKEYNLRRFGY